METSRYAWRCVLLTMLLWGIAAEWARSDEPSAPNRLDLLIVAPHSDDEAIGCTGVILRAIAAKQRVGVVVLTAGDGFPKAAAAATGKAIDTLAPDDFVALATLRQRHSLQAMTRLGILRLDLLFLGYPDGGLAPMYNAQDGAPYRQPYTGRMETYGTMVADYHSLTHGRPASYNRASVIADLVEILQNRKPRAIYVTGETDTHADHRATFWFVRDAAQVARYDGPLWTYIVHGDPPDQLPDRTDLLTKIEFQTKRSVLESYQAGVSPVHDRLAEIYTKPDERFWLFRRTATP